MNENKDGFDGVILIYIGFVILGCVLCGIYGVTANQFQQSEIFLLVIAGAVAGFSLGLICNGIISRIRK